MGLIGPFGYTGGLNTKPTALNQKVNQLYVLQNLRSVSGSLKERYCATNWNTTQLVGDGVNHNVQNLTVNNVPGSSSSLFPVLTVVDGKISKISNAGAETVITGATTFGVGGQGSYSNSDILNGRIVIGDPSGSGGAMATWNNTGNATMLTSPQCNVVRSVNNFMFALDAAGSANSRVYWSNVGDPTSWNGSNNYVDFRVGDGDTVVDIHYIGTDLYIFKRRSIGRLSTLTVEIAGAVSLGPLTTVFSGIGSAGPGCVGKLPDGRLVFLGSDSHCYIFDGSFLKDISSQDDFGPNVSSLLYSCSPTYASGAARCCVYPPRNEVWFICTVSPISSGNPYDTALVYDYQNNSWSHFLITGQPTTFGSERAAQTLFVPSNGDATFQAFGALGNIGNLITGYGGCLLMQDPLSQGGALFTIEWRTSIVLAGEARNFIPRSMILPHVSSGTSASAYSVSFGFDGGSFGTATTINNTTSYQRSQIKINVPPTGFESIQIKVIHASSNGVQTVFEPFFLSDEVLI